MLPIEQRQKVKILWLSHCTTPEIAELINQPVPEIQALVDILQSTNPKSYQDALDYFQNLDTVPYGHGFTTAIHKAEDALQDCIEMGRTGED